MHRANLAAAVNVSPLQHLGDRMRAAARQLRLFIAGDHFQNFDAAAGIVRRDAARNRHLRQHQRFHRVVFEQLVHNLRAASIAKAA